MMMLHNEMSGNENSHSLFKNHSHPLSDCINQKKKEELTFIEQTHNHNLFTF